MQTEVLQFIFMEKDFYLDAQANDSDAEHGRWRRQFEEDKYQALYQMGFEEKAVGLTVTGNFLYLISNSFLKQLTDMPELEIARGV